MTQPARRILLVEDDEVLRENYSALLEAHGFEVRACPDEEGALQAFGTSQYDLVMLDVTLGHDYEAGFNLCSRIRSTSELVPIIFLTERDEEHNKISGLRLGADDYLSKTISAPYLVARVNALIRRAEVLRGSAKSGNLTDVPAAAGPNISIDDKLSRAAWRGTPLDLPLTQFWMLRDLVIHAGEVRSTADLMAAAKITVQPNTVVAHIKSIREAIQAHAPGFAGIRSERARGYRWLDEGP